MRGINLGARNRISMPQLREVLADVGYTDIETYMQSGNVVLSSELAPADLARASTGHIATAFGLSIDAVARTAAEMAAIVEADPLGAVATDPKRYQVSFLAAPLEPAAVQRLQARAVPPERFVADGHELYAWHPGGVARSKLWSELASPRLGVTATARNWSTVTSLAAMAAQ